MIVDRASLTCVQQALRSPLGRLFAEAHPLSAAEV
jgi:hypothetical protein